jgi:hypothetical protein
MNADPIFKREIIPQASREVEKKVISIDLDLLVDIDKSDPARIVVNPRDFIEKYLALREEIKGITNPAGKPVFDIVLFSRHNGTREILESVGLSDTDFDKIYTLLDIQAVNSGEFKESPVGLDLVGLIESDYSGDEVRNEDKDIMLLYREEDSEIYGTEEILRKILHIAAGKPTKGEIQSISQLLTVATDVLANDGEISDELRELLREAKLKLPEILENELRLDPVSLEKDFDSYMREMVKTRGLIERAA